MPNENRILHIVPDSACTEEGQWLGSTKDIRSRTEYFRARNIRFDELQAPQRSDEQLLTKLERLDFARYSAVLFEYPLYPQCMRYLRRHAAHLCLLVRSHNAEFYHWLHHAVADSRLQAGNGRLATFRRLGRLAHRDGVGKIRYALRRLHLDYTCARLAHYVLSITDWERRNYWSYLAPERKTVWVSYFLPLLYYPRSHPPVVKKNRCVCMNAAVGTGAFLVDGMRNFCSLVAKLNGQRDDWTFCATGNSTFPSDKGSAGVEFLGVVDELFDLLASSRAVAVLSDYGFGLKTKLLDAICHGCFVLVTSKLYARLPVEIQPYCRRVDVNDPQSFRSALGKCLEPFPEADVNELLRKQAFAALDGLMRKCEILPA